MLLITNHDNGHIGSLGQAYSLQLSSLFYSLHDETEPEEFKLIIDVLRKSCGTLFK